MTNEEAIDVLKDIYGGASHEAINTSNDKYARILLADCEAITMAIEALEKQIPKKPNVNKRETIEDVYVLSYRCPCCGNELIYRADCFNKGCKQAIDWSSDNENDNM